MCRTTAGHERVATCGSSRRPPGRMVADLRRMLRLSSLIVVCALGVAHGETVPVIPAQVRAHATKLVGKIAIDGHLDEDAWKTAPRESSFVQRFPERRRQARLRHPVRGALR